MLSLKFTIFELTKNAVKLYIPKYQSIVYLLLFVFQIAFFHSTTAQNLSIQYVQGSSHDSDNSKSSSDQDDLIDYENDDSEEKEDNQENEEEQEVDGEIDFVKDLSPFSEGGRVNSNFQLVGEKGPEIVKMPRGSTVYSNAVSKQMISRGSNTVVNNMSITINARDTSDAELRRIADKIGNMVNNKINRRTSSRTLG